MITKHAIYNRLIRARWPDWRERPPYGELPSIDEMLAWAAKQPDIVLLSAPSTGRGYLRAIRAFQPPITGRMGDPIYGQPDI